MFAIIESGSKQYRVAVGDKLVVEKLEVPAGQPVEFKEVLLVCDGDRILVGRPLVDGALVSGVMEGEEKAKKLYPLKKKRRKNYVRRIGHRQKLSAVRIKEIKA